MRPTMRNHIQRGSAEDLDRWISEAAQQMNRNPVQLRLTVGDQATMTRLITAQVCNRRRESETARVPVTFWISTTEDGAPNITGISGVTVSKGFAMLSATGVYQVLPDSDGQAQISVTASGAGSWWIFATAGDEPVGSGLVSWV